jgi:hypothetical protein
MLAAAANISQTTSNYPAVCRANSVFENANRCLKASFLNSDNGTIQLWLTVLSIFKKI